MSPAQGAAQEFVALYDPSDPLGRVTGSAPRAQVRSQNLPHAASGVLVRDSAGRVLMHERSATKDLWPSHIDAASGGVIGAGEDPLDAAYRELAEELGIEGAPLRPLMTCWYRDDDTQYLAHLYETTWDRDVRFPDGEVARAWWATPSELAAILSDPQVAFVPDTRWLLSQLTGVVPDGGPWPVGAPVAIRFGRLGRCGVRMARVAQEDEDGLLLWVASGSPTVARQVREAQLEATPLSPAAAERLRRPGHWFGHGIYQFFPRRWNGYSVWFFFDDDGSFRGWYANLEAAPVRRRTALGSLLLDTADRALDVWVPVSAETVQPQWKDEDEFEVLTGRPGYWTVPDQPGIRADGQAAMDAAVRREGPFDGRWTTPPPAGDPLHDIAALPVDWDLPHLTGP